MKVLLMRVDFWVEFEELRMPGQKKGIYLSERDKLTRYEWDN
jgi:hypothetical protein